MTSSPGKRFLFAAAGVALGLLLLEGAARLTLNLLGKSWGAVVPPSIFRFDSKLGWSLKPGSRATSKRTGLGVDYRINSQGLRDQETSYQKPAGVFRIVLLGDSRSFGFGVPIEKHFSRLLEDYFQNLEVINLGVDGYGIDQELLYLRAEGFRYQPNLVLTYLPHFRDQRHMHTKRWGLGKPAFVLRNGQLVLVNSPVSNNSPGLLALRRIDQRLAGISSLYQVFRDSTFYLAAGDNGLRRLARRAGVVHDAEGGEERKDDQEFGREMEELGQAIILAMARESKRHGANFVLVTQMPELIPAAARAGVTCLDVSSALANPGFYLPDDLHHINESGNGVLAWEIARFLRANSLIPARSVKKD